MNSWSFQNFYHEGVFCQMLSQHLIEWSCVFSLSLFIIVDYLMDFLILNHPCTPGMKPSWSWWMIALICCWIQSKNFIEYFCIYIHKGNWCEVMLFCWVFLWFSYQCNCDFIEWMVPSLSILWNSLKSIGIQSSLMDY